MSLFGEFHVPADAFTLHETLQQVPDATIEIERVVAADELLTPYFWVSVDTLEAFEAAIEADPSVHDLRQLDEFDEATLYRARWTGNVESIVYAYTEIDATLLEATGQHDRWSLQIRFDAHEQLERFQEYCDRHDIPFTLQQLQEVQQAQTGSQYGLTPKQQAALRTAWELEYYRSSDVDLADVAAELDVSQQSVSKRLHRGYHTLIENTVAVTPPEE